MHFICSGIALSREKEMATHSTIFAWRIPWTEEPGELQSTESQRVFMTESDLALDLYLLKCYIFYENHLC